ncbi:hypothetical protein MMC20_000434 [Loxospora ochrophaea]|nr:hypothetical protein [Loxospora ochrophaea]
MYFAVLLLASIFGSLASGAAIIPRRPLNWPSLAIKLAASPPIEEVCDTSSATMPQSSPPLPPPSPGLYLYHVAVGRGTQNYTCATSDSSSVPSAIGALATLYNATCVAATSPSTLASLPALALNNPRPAACAQLSPADIAISGHHYFVTTTTPTFNLDTSNGQYGITFASKNASVPAPAGSVVGQNNSGNGAVPWLKLESQGPAAGTVGPVQEIYRVNTAGGQPPATCAGQPATLTVQYSAEYWFYAK